MIKKYNVTVDGKTYAVEVEETDGARANYVLQVGMENIHAQESVPVVNAPVVSEQIVAPAAPMNKDSIKGETLRAPMPGTILSVTAVVGQVVKRGEILLVLEAMKMENEIVANADGTISGIFVQKGANVQAGDILVAFA